MSGLLAQPGFAGHMKICSWLVTRVCGTWRYFLLCAWLLINDSRSWEVVGGWNLCEDHCIHYSCLSVCRRVNELLAIQYGYWVVWAPFSLKLEIAFPLTSICFMFIYMCHVPFIAYIMCQTPKIIFKAPTLSELRRFMCIPFKKKLVINFVFWPGLLRINHL